MVIAAAAIAVLAVLALVWGTVDWIRTRRLRTDLAAARTEVASAAQELERLRRTVAMLRAGEREAAWAVGAAAERRADLTTRLHEVRGALREATDREAALQARLDSLSDSSRSTPGDAAAAGPESRRLEERLLAREATIADLRDRLEGLSRARVAEVRRLSERIDELERLHVEIDRRDREITRLEEALKESEEARRQVEDEVQRIDRTTAGTIRPGSELEVRALREALRAERERNARLVRRTSLGGPDRPSAEGDEVRRLRRRVAELEGSTQAVPAPLDETDVTAIKGIGPKIAEILAGLGITSLRQVAQLTEPDLDRIGEHLPVYGRRARDDRWVDQARRLLGFGDGG